MRTQENKILKEVFFDSPLGPLLAIGDDTALYLLEFVERRGLERELVRLRKKLGAAIIPGQSTPLLQIEEELKAYFEGKLTEFKTALCILGSSFQKRVWEELQKIPYGKTISYLELAIAIGKPTACQAVAQANGCNQLALIIPCHRVINTGGALGGYGGGVHRKEWLLKQERAHLALSN